MGLRFLYGLRFLVQEFVYGFRLLVQGSEDIVYGA